MNVLRELRKAASANGSVSATGIEQIAKLVRRDRVTVDPLVMTPEQKHWHNEWGRLKVRLTNAPDPEDT